MKIENFTTVAEIEQSRSPVEYVNWFDGLLDRIDKDRDDELTSQELLKTGLAKRFYEELFPLYALLKHKTKEWNNSRFLPALGSQSYDVEVLTADARIPKWLEITNAIDGKDYNIRMNELIKDGVVSMSGEVIFETGENGKKIPRIEVKASFVNDVIKRISLLIQNRVTAKSSKNYASSTGLVIWVHDIGTFRKDKNFEQLQEVITTMKAEWQTVFSHVFLLLSSNGCLFEAVSESIQCAKDC